MVVGLAVFGGELFWVGAVWGGVVLGGGLEWWFGRLGSLRIAVDSAGWVGVNVLGVTAEFGGSARPFDSLSLAQGPFASAH